jgi:hypothetical protein
MDPEQYYLVTKISDTGSTSRPSTCPSPSERKGRESTVRREAYRQAVEERASAGMCVEFSLTAIPEEVFCMTGETLLN